MAQSLDAHEWQNRVILLFAPKFEHPTLQNQLKIFDKNMEELENRKLIVYQITPTAAKLNGKIVGDKNFSKALFEKYKPSQENFSLVLVGLDGGEKMRKISTISVEDLFGKIDQMPMRKEEMKRNEK